MLFNTINNLQVKKDNILLIDLDNTLIFSDKANNLSYLFALEKLGLPTLIDINTRIIKENFSPFSQDTQQKIFKIKQEVYPDFIHETKNNQILVDFLLKVANTKILVSHSNPIRAEMLLDYHQLNHLFSHKIFCKNQNKYELAIGKLGLNLNQVLIFDNEPEQLINAKKLGILPENLFYIS